MIATHSPLHPADDISIAAAAEIVRAGGVVAFPTETVYGLGADATNDRAVAAIFAAKGRPRFNPLIVHVKDAVGAEQFVTFTPLARTLANAFWPGALTLVLPRKGQTNLSLLVSAGLDTVALRAPAHPVAQHLLDLAERPIAAPSANSSGRVSATTAVHVLEELRGRVDFILDGGATTLGLESTVLGFEDGRAILLRPGAIARDAIERVAGSLAPPTHNAISSPGQLSSHYTPRAVLRLNAHLAMPSEALLAFGPTVPTGAKYLRNLSANGDLREAAANFFSMLRELDASGAASIAVMPIPDSDLGEAINDRLRRAAAPRRARGK